MLLIIFLNAVVELHGVLDLICVEIGFWAKDKVVFIYANPFFKSFACACFIKKAEPLRITTVNTQIPIKITDILFKKPCKFRSNPRAHLIPHGGTCADVVLGNHDDLVHTIIADTRAEVE